MYPGAVKKNPGILRMERGMGPTFDIALIKLTQLRALNFRADARHVVVHIAF